MSITVALVLNTLICLCLLSSADKIGRKVITLMTSVCIITGMSIAVFHPEIFGKVMGIGIALGAEGTFTALFSILINETTCKCLELMNWIFRSDANCLVKQTKIRSNLVSAYFVAYGLGSILVNVITLYLRSSDSLARLCWISVTCAVLPSFVSFVETPKFQYKAGKLTGLVFVLERISGFNKKDVSRSDWIELFSENDKVVADTINSKQIYVKIKGKNKDESQLPEIAQDKKDAKSFKEMFTTKEYLVQVIVLSLQGGVLYLIFYGMTISVQDLGLKNINQNGIFFGITQTLGYLVVLPFIHK